VSRSAGARAFPKEALEEETRRWAFLCPVEPVAVPAAGPGEDGDMDPHSFPASLITSTKCSTKSSRIGAGPMSEPNGIELSMGEGNSELQVASTEGSPVWTLDALAHAAWQLEPPAPHEKKAVLRPEAAHLVDSLLARVARGRGALDVAIGAALSRLSEGDRVLQLGYSSIGD
jgi:hypothetical protein